MDFFGDFGLQDTFQERIAPKPVEIDMDKPHMEFSYAACPCLSQLVSAQFALEMCLAARNHHARGHQRTVPPLCWPVVRENGCR